MQALFDALNNDMLRIYDELVSVTREEFLEKFQKEAQVDAGRGVNIFSPVYKQNKARALLGLKADFTSVPVANLEVKEPKLPASFRQTLERAEINSVHVEYMDPVLVKTAAARLQYYGKKINGKFSYSTAECDGQVRMVVKRVS